MARVTPLIQPLALSYQWSSDGHISPDTPFPGASPAGSYTGRPTGSADFSFWQTGQIQAVCSPDATTQQQPSFEVFTAFGSQWSPDRQFLAQSLVHEGVVGGQGHPDQVACAAAGRPATCTLTALPFPDAAFAVVVHAVQQAPNTLPNARTGVSWSPDGKLLAAVLPADELSSGSPGSSSFVTLLDVATGQPVKHLRYLCPTAPSYSGFRNCSADSPVWSPTGQQIALLDTGAVQLALLKV